MWNTTLRYLIIYQVMFMYHGDVYIATELQQHYLDFKAVNRNMFDRQQTNKHMYVNRSKNREFELRDAVHLYNAAIQLRQMSKLLSPWNIYYRIIGKTAPVNYCNKSQNNVVGNEQVVPATHLLE